MGDSDITRLLSAGTDAILNCSNKFSGFVGVLNVEFPVAVASPYVSVATTLVLDAAGGMASEICEKHNHLYKFVTDLAQLFYTLHLRHSSGFVYLTNKTNKTACLC